MKHEAQVIASLSLHDYQAAWVYRMLHTLFLVPWFAAKRTETRRYLTDQAQVTVSVLAAGWLIIAVSSLQATDSNSIEHRRALTGQFDTTACCASQAVCAATEQGKSTKGNYDWKPQQALKNDSAGRTDC